MLIWATTLRNMINTKCLSVLKRKDIYDKWLYDSIRGNKLELKKNNRTFFFLLSLCTFVYNSYELFIVSLMLFLFELSRIRILFEPEQSANSVPNRNQTVSNHNFLILLGLIIISNHLNIAVLFEINIQYNRKKKTHMESTV